VGKTNKFFPPIPFLAIASARSFEAMSPVILIDPEQYILKTFVTETWSPKVRRETLKRSRSLQAGVKLCRFDNSSPLGISVLNSGQGIVVTAVKPNSRAAKQNVEVRPRRMKTALL
jgi:S1-C subfamily serine protease